MEGRFITVGVMLRVPEVAGEVVGVAGCSDIEMIVIFNYVMFE